MSRAQSLLFGVAVVFAGWNILNNGLSVRSGGDCAADHNLPGHQYLQ